MEIVNSITDVNHFSISELNYIRETIENMNKFNQIEVLRILKKDNFHLLNENKNGVLVNLSELDKSAIDNLQEFIKYVNTQENELNKDEQTKEVLQSTFFS